MGHAQRKPRQPKHAENIAIKPKLPVGWMLIFKAISEPLVVVDRLGWVIFANLAWEKMVGTLEKTGGKVHITRHLPALAALTDPSGVHEITDRPMMLKDIENRLVSVLISARFLPEEHALVVQARRDENGS